MPPKSKPVDRDSMPKRPTESMMEPPKDSGKVSSQSVSKTSVSTKESVTTRSVSQSVSRSSASSTKETELTVPYFITEHKETSLKDPEQAGWLSLKHLNTLLLRYIGVVHDLEEDNIGQESGEINISIDQKEMTFLDRRYQDEIEGWKTEQKNSLNKIAELQAIIAKLKAEIEKLKKSGDALDVTIKEKEKLIETLRMEVSSIQASLTPFLNQDQHFHGLMTRLQGEIGFLTGELNAAMASYQAEEIRGQDLSDRLDSLKAELQFKIEVLETELTSEREKTTVDMSSMDVRIKGEYINRLKVEIDILRGTYEEFMARTQQELEEKYKDKLTKLELELSLALSKHSSSEDIAKIRLQIEKLQAKIEELRKSNLELSLTWSKLSVEMHEEETSFRAQLSVREREIEHYSKETARIQSLLEVLNKRLLEERAEVQVYDRLLTPEIQRIRSRHSSVTSSPVTTPVMAKAPVMA